MVGLLLAPALLAPALPGAAAAPGAAAGRVTARLELPSRRLRAGSTVHGKLVLTNAGDLPVDLNHGCAPRWEVVLGRGNRAPGVAFTLDCGVEPFVVKPGTSRLPFELAVGRKRSGCYRAFLVSSDPTFPMARPVRVTVLSAK